MKSTLNYISDSLRDEELTREKCLNFQREMFLHEPQDYDKEMGHLQNYLTDYDIFPDFLTKKELLELYHDPEEYGKYLILS